MTITIWHSKSHPDKAVTVHDFSIYYILAPIMGGSLIAYLLYKKKSHNDSAEN